MCVYTPVCVCVCVCVCMRACVCVCVCVTISKNIVQNKYYGIFLQTNIVFITYMHSFENVRETKVC